MSAAPDRSSWKINSVKRKKLFSGEGGTAAELTPQMTSVNISNEERGERLERASTSKSVDAEEANSSVVEEYADEVCATQCPEDKGSGKDCKTYSNSVGDETPKRNLRIRTPLKNSVSKVKQGLVNGEREWSTEDKEKILFIFESDGFDGDYANLAEKLPNQSTDSIRYLLNHFEQEREKHNWEMMFDTKIEELREMDESQFTENFAFCFQLLSLFGNHPPSSVVGGVHYAAIYGYISSLMRGEVPQKLNTAIRAKLSQVFHVLKQRILAEPKVPLPAFKKKAGNKIEKKKELKERRAMEWSADKLEVKEILLSGEVRKVEEFYLSLASLNPF